MAFNIKQLIQTAPFPDDKKKALIENLNKMTEDQKYRIVNTAWYTLAQIHFAKLEAERQKIMDEVVHEERKFNPRDLEEIEKRLIEEFAYKLETAKTQETLEEIRQQLEKYKTKS